MKENEVGSGHDAHSYCPSKFVELFGVQLVGFSPRKSMGTEFFVVPMAGNKDNNGSTKIVTILDVGAIAIGVGAVVFLSVYLAYFYGTGNETAASGMLGIGVPVIATMVTAVVGVSIGTSSGKSAGKQMVDDKEKAISNLGDELDKLTTKFATPHKSRHSKRELPYDDPVKAAARDKEFASLAPISDEKYDEQVMSQIDRIRAQLKALAPHYMK